MSHTIRVACAVAVTETPATDAVADVGPHVDGVTSVQNHTGRPTRPVEPGGGAIPIDGPRSSSISTASTARSAGVTATAPNPDGGFGRTTHPLLLLPPPGSSALALVDGAAGGVLTPDRVVRGRLLGEGAVVAAVLVAEPPEEVVLARHHPRRTGNPAGPRWDGSDAVEPPVGRGRARRT